MHIRILGSAAGGGFPQWNDNGPNCKVSELEILTSNQEINPL